MPRVGFEPTISAGERPKTYALDRAATGTGICIITKLYLLVVETVINDLEEELLKKGILLFDVILTVHRR